MGHIHVCEASASPCDDPEDQVVLASVHGFIRDTPRNMYVSPPTTFFFPWHQTSILPPIDTQIVDWLYNRSDDTQYKYDTQTGLYFLFTHHRSCITPVSPVLLWICQIVEPVHIFHPESSRCPLPDTTRDPSTCIWFVFTIVFFSFLRYVRTMTVFKFLSPLSPNPDLFATNPQVSKKKQW